MNLFTLILLAAALGTDALSLSVGLGMGGIKRAQGILFATAVFLLHVLMPGLGYEGGRLVGVLAGKAAALVGAVVLILLGLKMAYEAVRPGEEERGERFAFLNTWGVMALAGSVSVDALSVGFSLGTQRIYLGWRCLLIGMVAAFMTVMGLFFGTRLSRILGEKGGLAGGLVLIGIGLKMLVA